MCLRSGFLFEEHPIKIQNCSRGSFWTIASLRCANKTFVSRSLAVKVHTLRRECQRWQRWKFHRRKFRVIRLKVSPLSFVLFLFSRPISICLRAARSLTVNFSSKNRTTMLTKQSGNIESSNPAHPLIHRWYWCFQDYFYDRACDL